MPLKPCQSLGLSFGLLLLSASALAQDASLPPNYGTVDLVSGFLPDPELLELSAGGDIYVGQIDFENCGYVSEAPDYRLNYEAGFSGLGIYVNADVDTTLIISSPDGRMFCNDDNDNLIDFAAGYYFDAPLSGEYNIWVGTFSESDIFSDAILAITEYPENSWETNLTPTFSQDTFRLRVLNNTQEIQTGLATLVAENTVLTNADLVSQGDQLIVENLQTGASLLANIRAVDQDAGLALLTVNGIGGTPALLATDFPESGRNVSLALLDANRDGILLGLADPTDEFSQARHTALALDGEYGAAVLNNCNEVIGISQHDSPVLSNRLRPDEDFAFIAPLARLYNFLDANNVDYSEAFDFCLSEAELLSLAEEKIRQQEEELMDMLLEQDLLLEDRIRLQEQADALEAAQAALEAENQARLDELAAREAELADTLAAIEQAQANQLELEARQQELEQQTREQEEALQEAGRQQEVAERNRLYQWGGFGVVLIALFGFVAVQVKKRRATQEEAEENIKQAKQKTEKVEAELQKASAEFPDIVLIGTDASGSESRLKINGKALIRSENGQIIGRSAQHADYVLNQETVSRRHLHLLIRDGKIFVDDLGSANGTSINNSTLVQGRPQELRAGDTLKIGTLSYQVNLLENQA